ncbi:conjugal transfer protein TrbL family protein [Actinoplanes sp. G11-F43]|uniref:conjugal transfer protein TrbL family protein n=1 Tax=Actinoplanes sp. G11-F43 TaxID=3424130 RepID=UPI003D3569A1
MGWLDGILDWFAELLLDSLNTMIAVITDVLLITPNVTGLPQVQALTGRAVWIVDTVFVLVFLAAGVLTMTNQGDERSRYTVKDLIPRCVVGFITAHFSQLIAGQMIDLANALTGALTEQNWDSDGAFQAMRTHVTTAGETGGILFLVCVSIILFLMAATGCSAIVRFAVALVLTAGAPIALACHALPQTDPVARLWWRSFVGVLAVPILQGFVLFAAQWMLLDPQAMLPLLGLPVEPGSVFNLFVVMVLLWTCVRVPGLVRRYATEGGRGSNFLGAVVRVVVVQQISRALPGIGRAFR